MQGDIIELVDINGNSVVKYKYDAWGNIISQTGGDLAEINPYRYRGYRYDVETGWYYLQSRYYNPNIGRFISADGLIGEQGEILGHNTYAYCQNNPIMYHDPSGHLGVLLVFSLVLLAGGLASAIGQMISNGLNGDELFTDTGVAFTKGVIASGVGYFCPSCGVFTYSSLNQVENYMENGNVSAGEFILDTVIGFTTMGIVNKFSIKINSGWVRNLKLENIPKNLFSGKVTRYALNNFAMEIGGETITSLIDYAFPKVRENVKGAIMEAKYHFSETYESIINKLRDKLIFPIIT
jgi:RHS repeat-associated protein